MADAAVAIWFIPSMVKIHAKSGFTFQIVVFCAELYRLV